MITIYIGKCKNFNQQIYNKIISKVSLEKVTCTCGHSNCLSRHGFYFRTLKYKSNPLRIKILRVICNICKHTHALLLSIIVPYSQIPLFDQQAIILNIKNRKKLYYIMQNNLCIDENNISKIIHNFKFYWEERLYLFGIELKSELTSLCFLYYGLQFMQIKTTANILFNLPHKIT